jgi:hypothetical protein
MNMDFQDIQDILIEGGRPRPAVSVTGRWGGGVTGRWMGSMNMDIQDIQDINIDGGGSRPAVPVIDWSGEHSG